METISSGPWPSHREWEQNGAALYTVGWASVRECHPRLFGSVDSVDKPLVLVAETVWETWRKREADVKKPSIAIILTDTAPPETALDALAEATREVMQPRLAKAEAAGPGEEEFRTGYCSFTRAPQGVVLRIDEGPDDFKGLLRGIADGLQARGIEGRFDLYEPEGIPEIPELVDLFECHLRLEGERTPVPPAGNLFWLPTPSALERAVETGAGWCRDNASGLPLSLRVGLLPAVTLSAEDDIERYVLEGIESAGLVGVVSLTSAAPDRFRTFTVKRLYGRAGRQAVSRALAASPGPVSPELRPLKSQLNPTAASRCVDQR